MIQGQFFGFTSASAVAGEDMITKLRALTGKSDAVPKMFHLYTSGSLAFDINNLGVDSTLFQFSDGLYKLEIEDADCLISSFKISQTTACPIHIDVIF